MFRTVLFTVGFIFFSENLYARSQIKAVGSSTVYPFITAAAEEFGRNTDFKTPIIEATGTGGGFKLFCSGVGYQYPDIANASRPIKEGEKKICAKSGITDIAEIRLGYDGIVLANSKKIKKFNLTTKQIFLALAPLVPQDGKLVKNKYKKWSDIDPSLPNGRIRVYGPPPTSGTRDAFVELVMQHECMDLEEFKAAYSDQKTLKAKCSQVRDGEFFIEAGENDNIIVQKLITNEDSLGIFGFSFLENNSSLVHGALINGYKPSFNNIAAGKYPISRSLFVYVKEDHYEEIPSLKEFVQFLVSDEAVGPEGTLPYKGLIPLRHKELKAQQKRFQNL